MHHPLMSNGSHGGQFYRKTNFPIRAKNSLTSYWLIYKPTKKNDRASPQDIQNKQYTAYVKRIKTLYKAKTT
jgi:hypothetical protein